MPIGGLRLGGSIPLNFPFKNAVAEDRAAFLAHLGFKPKANRSSPLVGADIGADFPQGKRTKNLATPALQPVSTGFGY
jgi:hypothetical protein